MHVWCDVCCSEPETFEVWQTGHYDSSWQRGRNSKENNLGTFLYQGQIWSKPAKEMTRYYTQKHLERYSYVIITSVFQIFRLMTPFLCVCKFCYCWNVNISLIIFWSCPVNTSAFFFQNQNPESLFLCFFSFLVIFQEKFICWIFFGVDHVFMSLQVGERVPEWREQRPGRAGGVSFFCTVCCHVSHYQLFSLFTTAVHMQRWKPRQCCHSARPLMHHHQY